MTGSLRCYSFHSVKGGVGKSALSTMTALAEAARDVPTLLIDMDLTGTSLSDVLPLDPPRFPAENAALHLREKANGFLGEAEARAAIDARQDAQEGPLAVGAPFLNDYLLFQTPSWDEQLDIEDPAALGWKMRGAPDSLRVLPSSALPRDLERILPVVFDEERAAFLEARLEYLLDALVPDTGERVLVIDTPPTIPGLSRAVLSLALRLGHGGPKQPLAEDGTVPDRLAQADLRWQAFIVSTTDWQDVRAAARWIELLRDEERDVVRWLINRADPPDSNREEKLRSLLSRPLSRPDVTGAGPGPSTSPSGETGDDGSFVLGEQAFQSLRWIEEAVHLKTLFRRSSEGLRAPEGWLDALEGRA